MKNQCPTCKRVGYSDLLFAGMEGLCIDCYMEQEQQSHDITLLLELGGDAPAGSVARVSMALIGESDFCIAEGAGQMSLLFPDMDEVFVAGGAR